MTGTATDLIHRYFDAFLAGDRETVDELLGDDFRFSSPDDPRLDKAGFFERCWPNRDHMHDFRLTTVVEHGEETFIRYEARTDSGERFSNMERLRTDGGRILAAEVYYGPPSPDGGD
jgi:ketosteroid isomerase-like protein